MLGIFYVVYDFNSLHRLVSSNEFFGVETMIKRVFWCCKV